MMKIEEIFNRVRNTDCKRGYLMAIFFVAFIRVETMATTLRVKSQRKWVELLLVIVFY